MKKAIFLLVIVFFGSCKIGDIFRTTKPDPVHTSNWYLKNLTENPVKLMMRDWKRQKVVVPGDSLDLFVSHPPQADGMPTFSPFFTFWQPDYWGEEQYLTISSADGEELKTWKYTPESAADDPFFQESSWQFYQREYDTSSELELTWVYDLLPEDLNPDDYGNAVVRIR